MELTANLPIGWTFASLYELAEKQKAKFDDGDWIEAEHITDRGVRLVQTGNIGIGRFVEKDVKKYIFQSSYEKLNCKQLFVGDLLICRLAEPAGRACVFPDIGEEKVVTSVDVTIFRPNADAVDRRYLVQYLSTRAWFETVIEQVGGTTHKRIARSALGNIPIPLPADISEQNLIATALTDVDTLIAGLEKLIAKKRDLKQAAMQQLLTGQTRLPGFSGEWVRNDLKNLVSTPITDGPHLTPTFYETGVPFLSVNNLANNRIDWSDLRFISKADDEIFSRKCKPLKGDVLLGKAASVGKVAIVEDDFDFNIWSPIALIRAGEQVNGKFLYYQLLSADCITQVLLLTNSSSQGNIGMGDIEKLQISYPCYEEQMAIAKVLADMDAELGSLETRLVKTRELKQGMMQELLTGRTRLL